MTTHDPVPKSPNGEEPLSDLFGDMLNLADQVASRISEDEVELRLRRVLKRARQRGGGDSVPLTVPFNPTEAILRGQGPSPLLEAQINELQQAVVMARSELAVIRAELGGKIELVRTAYAEAEKAHTDAMTAYEGATKVMNEAWAYHDAALGRAKSIVEDAKVEAEDIHRTAREKARADATVVMSEAWACRRAALNYAKSIVEDAKVEAEDIHQAAHEKADRRNDDHAAEQALTQRVASPASARCFVSWLMAAQAMSVREADAFDFAQWRTTWLRAFATLTDTAQPSEVTTYLHEASIGVLNLDCAEQGFYYVHYLADEDRSAPSVYRPGMRGMVVFVGTGDIDLQPPPINAVFTAPGTGSPLMPAIEWKPSDSGELAGSH